MSGIGKIWLYHAPVWYDVYLIPFCTPEFDLGVAYVMAEVGLLKKSF